tara:strand:- start:24674 stop:25285 length:612 start_codon:yes stop_codon:yes gene_type:complete
MTEEEVLSIIESVVNVLAFNFKFGYFDLDDMKQQGRMYALEALPRYKPEIGNLYNFLRSHVRNRFLNLQRDKLSRHQPPCPSCPFYDPEYKQSKNMCSAFEDKMECDKYTGWEKRNGAKRSLAEPLDISSIRDENEKNMRSNTDVPALVIRAELMGIIDKNLPVSLRADFKKMMEDVSVGKQKRDKVINAIREILEEDNGKAR